MSTVILILEVLSRRSRDERGASLMEYVLLVSFIAILLMAAITIFSNGLGTAFSQAGSSLDDLP